MADERAPKLGRGPSSMGRAVEAMAFEEIRQEEADREFREYDNLRKVLSQARILAAIYKELKIRPCELPRIHQIIRAFFGYH